MTFKMKPTECAKFHANLMEPTSRLVTCWHLLNKEIYLLEDDKDGIKALVKTQNLLQEIKKEWIEGIPSQVRQAPFTYQAFFHDTHAKLSLMSDGEYKLLISQGLKGGMEAGRPQAAENRQQGPRLGSEVLELLRSIIPHAQRARDKDVTAFIGPTGTGKSTIVNHMLGRRMILKHKERRGTTLLPERIEVEGEEAASIGHGRATAHTLYAETYPLPDHREQALVDCGGFYETRGLAKEIAVVTSVKLTLEAARSVKLALCCSHAAVMEHRSTQLTELLQIVLEELLARHQATNAVLFLITKPIPNRGHATMPTAESVVEHIEQMIEELGPDSERSQIYQYIIRENGRYVVMYDPLDDRSRTQTFNLLAEMDPIRDTQQAFNPAYSARAAVAILEEIVAIAVVGNGLLRDYFYNCQQTAACNTEIQGLQERVGRIRSLIGELGQTNADPEAIRQAEERLKTENELLIQQIEQEIRRLQIGIQEKNASVTAVNERLDFMDREGEAVESYWSDMIDQEGINIISVTTHTKSWSKSGFLGIGGRSGSEESKTETVDKRSIEKTFSCRGPEIDHVVKDPKEGNCWTNEQQTSTEYSIHYTSGKGEAAKARVEVFVKKKHFPEQIHQRLGLTQELAAENTHIYNLSQQITEQERRKHAAQLALNTSGNKMERLAEYERSLQELEQSLQELHNRNQRLDQEKARLQAAIQENEPDFTFLKDYLTLSHDRRLQERESIRDFLRQYADYQREAAHE